MDIKTISHIAKLSYLDLSQQELDQFSGDFVNILNHVSQLSEVNVHDVIPTAQATLIFNIFRDDNHVACNEDLSKDLMNAAPEIENEYVKVKAIL